ncbi:hypothetical protein IAT38_007393 [Cryptococcus sp. DSM 104549]
MSASPQSTVMSISPVGPGLRELWSAPTPRRPARVPPHVPGARVGITDLSEELIRMIATRTDEPHILMRVCKHTLFPAAAVLYRLAEPTVKACSSFNSWSIEDPLLPSLYGVLSGIEHDAPSPTAPYGRNLKMAFLGMIRKLECQVWSIDRTKAKKEYDICPVEKLVEIKRVFDAFAKTNICPFPNLHTLALHFYVISPETEVSGDAEKGPRPMRDPAIPFMRDLSRSFASIVRPTTFLWNLDYCLDEIECVGYDDLQFMGGHVPKVVKHRLAARCRTDEMEVPIVCHGATNVAAFLATAVPSTEHGIDIRTGSEMDVARMCVYRMRLANHLPAAALRRRRTKPAVLVEMAKRRGATKWVFQECASSRSDLAYDYLEWGEQKEDFRGKVRRGIVKEMPEMEDRVIIPCNTVDPFGFSSGGALSDSENSDDEEADGPDTGGEW